MHEFSIAQGLVAQLKELLALHQRRTVTSIRLSIGLFSGVVTESLLFSLKMLAEQEPALKEMKVEVQSPAVECTCSQCGHRFNVDAQFLMSYSNTSAAGIFSSLATYCPVCGSEFCTHRGGDELLLLTVEMT
ncbi:MAG: hydrogenase maturation nickel metallochaperone HypA [Dissulfuribacterales bacterium]